MTTQWGDVAGKVATLPDGSLSFSPEFEACRVIAEQHEVALRDIYDAARAAFSAR